MSATRISVSESGDVFINSNQTSVNDFTQELLEQIVDDALDDQVDFDIKGDLPISRFFRKLQEGTKEGSELRDMKEKYDSENAEKMEAGRKFVESHADDPA